MQPKTPSTRVGSEQIQDGSGPRLHQLWSAVGCRLGEVGDSVGSNRTHIDRSSILHQAGSGRVGSVRFGSVRFGSVRVGSGRVRARFSPRLPQIRPESVGCDSLGSGRAQADCTFRILHQFGFRPGSVPDCIKSGRVETEAGNSVGSGPLQSETASGRFRSRTT